jgi:hypothetical protein
MIQPEWIFLRDMTPRDGEVKSCAVFSNRRLCESAVRRARTSAKRAGLAMKFTTQRVEIVSHGCVIVAWVAVARRSEVTTQSERKEQ